MQRRKAEWQPRQHRQNRQRWTERCRNCWQHQQNCPMQQHHHLQRWGGRTLQQPHHHQSTWWPPASVSAGQQPLLQRWMQGRHQTATAAASCNHQPICVPQHQHGQHQQRQRQHGCPAEEAAAKCGEQMPRRQRRAPAAGRRETAQGGRAQERQDELLAMQWDDAPRPELAHRLRLRGTAPTASLRLEQDGQ